LPDRRTVGSAVEKQSKRTGRRLAFLILVGVTAAAGSAPAREWRAPWVGVVAPSPPAAPAPVIVVTETAPEADQAAGVDISMADLMAGGSELAGVAPRAATSGIGSDVERDLFTDGVPLNAPDAPAPENDPRDFLY